MNYVVGFAFDPRGERVALINKHQPDWQKGLFNGIGGKINDEDYTPTAAMVREFEEEAGVKTAPEHWQMFCKLVGADYEVYCFRMFSELSMNARTRELEEVIITPIHEAPSNIVQNLHWLIPMALRSRHFVAIDFNVSPEYEPETARK